MLVPVVANRRQRPSGLEGELQSVRQGQHPSLSHVKVASFVPLCAPKGQLETSAFLIIKVIIRALRKTGALYESSPANFWL